MVISGWLGRGDQGAEFRVAFEWFEESNILFEWKHLTKFLMPPICNGVEVV